MNGGISGLIIGFCGKIAIAVSCLVVIIVVCLFVLMLILTAWGGYESTTNPHATQDARQEYQNFSQELAKELPSLDPFPATVNARGTGP